MPSPCRPSKTARGRLLYVTQSQTDFIRLAERFKKGPGPAKMSTSSGNAVVKIQKCVTHRRIPHLPGGVSKPSGVAEQKYGPPQGVDRSQTCMWGRSSPYEATLFLLWALNCLRVPMFTHPVQVPQRSSRRRLPLAPSFPCHCALYSSVACTHQLSLYACPWCGT